MELASFILSVLLIFFCLLPFHGKIKEYLWLKKYLDKIPGPAVYFGIGTSYLFLGRSREYIFDKVMALDKQYAGDKGIYRLVHGTIPEIKVDFYERKIDF